MYNTIIINMKKILTLFIAIAFILPNYAEAALTDSLVSYWKLDETSGTRADAHSSNDLTDNNTVGYGTGIINNGADFERDNGEYLSITDAAQTGLDITGDISISMWVKAESIPADYMRLLGKNDADIENKGYYIQFRSPGANQSALSLTFYDDSSNATFVYSTDQYLASTGVWYHVVVTADVSAGASGVTLYKNGSSISATTGVDNATSISDTSAAFSIARNLQGSNPDSFDGIIDEVGVWNRVLTAEEVSDLYNSGAGFAYPFTPAATTTEDIIWFFR
jgi:hypothetical protein